MIKTIPGLPSGVLGFEVGGDVTRDDYETVLIPAVERALAVHPTLAVLYHVGPDFRRFRAGAMWDDAKIGLRHLTAWRRVALVTDVAWIQSTVRVLRWMLPGKVRVYANAQLDAARRWVIG